MRSYWHDRGRRMGVPGAARGALTISGRGHRPQRAVACCGGTIELRLRPVAAGQWRAVLAVRLELDVGVRGVALALLVREIAQVLTRRSKALLLNLVSESAVPIRPPIPRGPASSRLPRSLLPRPGMSDVRSVSET